MIRKVDKRGYPGRNLGHLVKDFKQERPMTDYPLASYSQAGAAEARERYDN